MYENYENVLLFLAKTMLIVIKNLQTELIYTNQ